MGVAHVGLVHCDPCECMVKSFRAVSSIERNVSKRRHLQGVRQVATKGISGMVELVCGPHHVSSGGEKGKFLSSGASAWASP